MANFDIDEATLASILDSKEHHFNIPDFQRDFTWESKSNNTGEFNYILRDLFEAFTTNPKEEYYLGTFITFKENDKDLLYEVIDGQQRLTSITIIIAAYLKVIRNTAAIDQTDGDTAAQILVKNEMLNDEKKVKILTTTDVHGQEFLDIMYKMGDFSTIEESEFVKNHLNSFTTAEKHFKKILKDKGVSAGHKINKKFFNFILRNVIIALVIAKDFRQAFTVFERMNDRGRDLSLPEQFKYILMEEFADDIEEFKDESQKVTKKWREISDIIEKNKLNFTQFIRYHLAARYFDSYLQESEILDWAKHSEAKALFGGAHMFLKNMKKDVELYVDFNNAKANNGELNVDLQFKRRFFRDVSQHYPLLLAASNLEIEKFELVAQSVMAIAITLSGTNTGWVTIESNLMSWIKKLRDGVLDGFIDGSKLDEVTGKPKYISGYLDEVAELLETKKKLLSAALTDSETLEEKKLYRICLVHYIEKLLYSNVKGTFDFNMVPTDYNTEEHIIPKVVLEPTSTGVERKSESIPSEKYEDELFDLVYRLGNLVILEHEDNWNADDHSVSVKFEKNIYADATNSFTAELVQKQHIGTENTATGSKKNKTIAKYHYEPIHLQEISGLKYFLKKEVLRREHSIFKVLSDFLGFELEHPEFDKNECNWCKDLDRLEKISELLKEKKELKANGKNLSPSQKAKLEQLRQPLFEDKFLEKENSPYWPF